MTKKGDDAELRLGIAAIVNLLNPSRLMLGGGELELLPGYRNVAARLASGYRILPLWRHCRLERVRTGWPVVALGAFRAAAVERDR
ncbi:MAG: hypothetical protein JO090_11100, partial [Rhizobacter sp.]|nr:hypothetical protein [Rhizobacter sp.]